MKHCFFHPFSITLRLTAVACIMLLMPGPGSLAFGFAREGECDDNPFPDTVLVQPEMERSRPW